MVFLKNDKLIIELGGGGGGVGGGGRMNYYIFLEIFCSK